MLNTNILLKLSLCRGKHFSFSNCIPPPSGITSVIVSLSYKFFQNECTRFRIF